MVLGPMWETYRDSILCFAWIPADAADAFLWSHPRFPPHPEKYTATPGAPHACRDNNIKIQV